MKPITLELSAEKLCLIALALTTSGLVSNGGYPSTVTMGVLVTRRAEFFELTQKIVEALDAA